MRSRKVDPRMLEPQCHELQPVETIHTNKWFSLLSRGGYFTMEYHTPQVIVLPIVDGHSIVMVRVKRPVIADNSLELPAGGTKKNESTAKAASRELHEEAGIHIDQLERFELLPTIAISPNRYPVFPWIYQVDITRDEYDTRAAHDSEIASVECMACEDIKKKIIGGEIYVSLPLAIISRFLLQEQGCTVKQ